MRDVLLAVVLTFGGIGILAFALNALLNIIDNDD